MSVQTPLQIAERLLAETREELRRADAKAMSCLQGVGGGGFAVITVSAVPAAHDWLWWAGCAGWAVSLICLASAVAPRLGGGGPAEVATFFGHIVRLRSPARVQRCIEVASTDALPGLVVQLCASSRIAMAKYRLIRIATYTAVGSAVLLGASLI